MQALTGLFARQFGTPNYAAHGGFCSVNMAAGMIYSIGGSFWEFGGPDLDRAKLFVMIGTAEDHHSNPLKIAISKFKRDGGRFVSINPVRTGYSAIADEWIPIKPGTDGALFMALLHELIAGDLVDHAFLKRYTNAPQLVVLDAGEREGNVRARPGSGQGPAGRRPSSAQQADLRHDVGHGDGGVSRRHRRRLRSGARGHLHAGRRHARRAVRSSSCASASRRARRTGRRRSPASRPSASGSWRASSARRRCSRPSSCRSRGPTPGASVTRRPRRGRSPSTPCAAWRRTRTASRRSAPWPC